VVIAVALIVRASGSALEPGRGLLRRERHAAAVPVSGTTP
jgi:hypothetical protein